MEKGRIVIIHKCNDCPHMYTKMISLWKEMMYCGLNDKQCDKSLFIPEWCQLPKEK